jgi:geranylgeranyl reductase family protein
MHDVIVVGAGPAGSVAARDLARAGARVALVDGSHPREKACGGGVTGRALQFARSAGAMLDGCAIDRAVFEAGRRRVVVDIDGDDVLRVFDREPFDGALLQDAVAAGAEHLPERAVACRRTGAAWEVVTERSVMRGSWLLGADGACGIVRKSVADPFERAELSIASGSYVDGVSVPEIVIGFTDEPRGYLWSFPRRRRLAGGACAQADATTSAALHGVTDRWLDGYAPAASHARRRYSWPIPSLSADAVGRQPASGDRWMLLGDAAGLVDPITREGIYFALESGSFAASSMSGVDPARAYGARVRDSIHPELRRAAGLKAAFFRPRFTRLLLDALDSSAAIRAVMIDLIAGRQPYSTLKRRLIGTLEFGLMAKVLFARGA